MAPARSSKRGARPVVRFEDGPGNVFFLSGCGGVCGCGTQTLRFEAVNVDQKYALLLSVGQLPQSATPVDPGGWHGGSTPPASPPSAERSSSGRALGVYTPYPSEPQGGGGAKPR
mmetsp:Transcript_36211/g.113907  ORF Transcript_36211/g.113907 Transcript_36211/m.113907 type:complete len:115 (-) Transcript_36211:297-641(-)